MNKLITVNGRQYKLSLIKNVFSNKYQAELKANDGTLVGKRNFRSMRDIQRDLKAWIITVDYQLQSSYEERVMQDLVEWDGEIVYDAY